MPRPIARTALTLLPLTAVLALAPASAWGHAAFLSAQPEPGTRFQTGPAEIELTFTEPLNRELSDASVVNLDTGDEVPVALATGGERRVLMRPQVRLGRAPYRVRWHTVSTLDGHPLEGSFSFGVRTAAAGGEQAVEQSPLARDGWHRIGARAILYASLFFFAGGVLNAVLLAPRGRPQRWLVPEAIDWVAKGSGVDPGRRADRLWQRTLSAGAVATVAAVAVAVIEAADAGGGLSLHSIDSYLLSNGAGLSRVGTVLAVALAAALARRWAIASASWLLLALLTVALSGHANSADPRVLAVLTDWVHLVAAAVWIGGIAQLAAAWLPGISRVGSALRLAVIRDVLSPFGRVALVAFAVVVLSGSLNALIELGHPQELWQSAYGRVLAVKIALVAAIAAASYAHALRLRPRLVAANPHPPGRLEGRHWRLLGGEPWLGLAVLLAAAALVAFPLPPRQLTDSEEAEAAAPCEPSCPLPGAGPEQLAVAENAGPNIAAFWLRRDGASVSGTMRLLGLDSKPVDASIEVDGGSAEGCGEGCWRLVVPEAGEALSVSVDAGGREREVTVPAEATLSRTGVAEGVLRRAQASMRALDTLRLRESLTSGTGVFVRSDYLFAAPDRMAYRTSSGTRLVAIGKTSYLSSDGGPFERRSFGAADGFRFRGLFRWSVYGRSVRWLGASRHAVRVGLFDPATPVWFRLRIDRRTGRVLSERMITRGHFMSRRYFDFDAPLRIEPPR
jgi:copper transport protein